MCHGVWVWEFSFVLESLAMGRVRPVPISALPGTPPKKRPQFSGSSALPPQFTIAGSIVQMLPKPILLSTITPTEFLQYIIGLLPEYPLSESSTEPTTAPIILVVCSTRAHFLTWLSETTAPHHPLLLPTLTLLTTTPRIKVYFTPTLIGFRAWIGSSVPTYKDPNNLSKPGILAVWNPFALHWTPDEETGLQREYSFEGIGNTVHCLLQGAWMSRRRVVCGTLMPDDWKDEPIAGFNPGRNKPDVSIELGEAMSRWFEIHDPQPQDEGQEAQGEIVD